MTDERPIHVTVPQKAKQLEKLYHGSSRSKVFYDVRCYRRLEHGLARKLYFKPSPNIGTTVSISRLCLLLSPAWQAGYSEWQHGSKGIKKFRIICTELNQISAGRHDLADSAAKNRPQTSVQRQTTGAPGQITRPPNYWRRCASLPRTLPSEGV